MIKLETTTAYTVEEAAKIRIYYQYKTGDSDEWEDDTDNMTVYKVDGKWYISIM